MLLLSQSSGLCVQSHSIIPVPGYPLCLVLHLRSLDDRFYTPFYNFCFLYPYGIVLVICRLRWLCIPLLLRTHINTGFLDLLFFSVLCLLCLCERLLICALWSPSGKGLTYCLSFVVSNCEFVTFPLVSWVRCDT